MNETTKKPRLYVFSHNRYASLDWALANGLQPSQIVHIRDDRDLHGVDVDWIELPSASDRRDYDKIRAVINARSKTNREIKMPEQLEEWKRAQRPQCLQ